MKYIMIFGLVTIILFSVSCQRNTDSDILGKWQVMTVKIADEEHDFQLLDYQLNFENDSLVSLKLDVNTCMTTYKLKNTNGIEFYAFGCTKACCDHNLSIVLLPELNRSKTVEIHGDDMELIGENTVYLKKI